MAAKDAKYDGVSTNLHEFPQIGFEKICVDWWMRKINDEGLDSVSALLRGGIGRGVGGSAVAGKWGVSLRRGNEVCERRAVGRQVGGIAFLYCAGCVWECEE